MAEQQYFGTDGIRGRVGSSLICPEFMLRLGWAAGNVMKDDHMTTALIGHDTRLSSDMLSTALQSGLLAAGMNVSLLGVLPTPAIAYLTHSLQACFGIVISASHNAYEDNGVKFFNAQGMKLSDQMEAEITVQLQQPMTIAKRLGAFIDPVDVGRRYVAFCKNIFPEHMDLTGIKLVLDCANGAAYDVAPRVFSELGAEVIVIHNTPNGKNINERCGAIDTHSLQVAVTQHQADVGLAFDGDGDRLMMVDHRGERVDGDEILCVLARDRAHRLQSGVGIVGTVMSNLGLEQSLTSSGVAFERASVGDRYVLEMLLRKGWVLGGESSGHIVDLDYTTTGDGIVTGLQVLRVIRTSKQPLSELKQAMVKRPQVLINVPVAVENFAVESIPEISQAVIEIERQLKGEGRVLLRASGTEPVVRVMVEGNNQEKVQKTAKYLASVVERCVE